MTDFNFQIYLNGEGSDGENAFSNYMQLNSEEVALDYIDQINDWADEVSVTPALALPVDLQPGEVGYSDGQDSDPFVATPENPFIITPEAFDLVWDVLFDSDS